MKSKRILNLPNFEILKSLLIWGNLANLAFIAIYGFCNQEALVAKHLYPLYTDWELSIPLVPWMIYPYMSLNLLLILAVLSLKSAQAIKALCVSLVCGAILAGLVFYLFPGQLGYMRIVPEGYESIYNFVFKIDHPHNLFPSLHVTYSALSVWAIQDQNGSAHPLFKRFMSSWLLLISVSVVLVHQHHIFDVISGALLAFILYKTVYASIMRLNH